MCFKSLSKTKIKILSYIDIFVGVTFSLLEIIGLLVILSQGMSILEPRLVNIILNIILAGLLLLSGIILVERETGQNATYVGWTSGILGFFFLVDTGLTFLLPMVNIPNIALLFGSLIGLVSYITLAVSGYYLRKLL